MLDDLLGGHIESAPGDAWLEALPDNQHDSAIVESLPAIEHRYGPTARITMMRNRASGGHCMPPEAVHCLGLDRGTHLGQQPCRSANRPDT
jgi:hypothetical protein